MSFMTAFEQHPLSRATHKAGTFPSPVLQRIERHLPARMMRSAETGCGKSTILFSNYSDEHLVFAMDDREAGDSSSVAFFEDHPLAQAQRVRWVFGPTQRTLPAFDFEAGEPFDCVLLDGPHAYPFPDLEYFFFFPHIRPGGLLIIDDVHIASIGRMVDILQEDPMFEVLELINYTAVLRRTDAPTFDPQGDGWWLQPYNRRRSPTQHPHHLDDRGEKPSMGRRLRLPWAVPPRLGLLARSRRALGMLRWGQ